MMATFGKRVAEGLTDVITCFDTIGTILFAGSADSGVYRSIDGGLSWKPANNGLIDDTVGALAVIGTNLIAGTFHYAETRDPEGIFLSTDSGASWTQESKGLIDPDYPNDTNASVFALALSSDTIFASVYEDGSAYLFRSTDSGHTWVDIHFLYAPALTVVGNNIIAGADDGFAVSDDNGAHWIDGTVVDPSFFYVNETTVYAGSNAGSNNGIYQSTDSGNTWSARSIDNDLYSPIIESNGKLYAFNVIGITVSTDSGVTWPLATGSLSSVPNISAINVNAFFMNGGTFYAGTDTGLFESSDSGWIFSSQGLALNDVQSYTAIGNRIFAGGITSFYVPNRDPRFPGYYYLTSSGIFSSNDNGKSWVEILDYLEYGDSNWYVSIASSGNTLFAGNTYSTDFGLTWNNDSIAPNFNSISGTNVFGEYDGNVFFSSNSGVGWRRITSDSSYNYTGAGASNENTLFIARSDDSILVLGTDGTSHVEFNTGLGYNTTIGSLQVADGYLYAYAGGALWRRPLSDFGISSVAQTPPVDSNSSLSVFPNPATNTLQIMGTQPGEVHLFDLMGRERMNAVTAGTGATLDVSQLEDGMYFLRSGSESAKVEIAH